MMIRVNRAIAANIVNYNHDYLRTLEEIGIITPYKRNYSYNQLILTRILLLIKDELNLIRFAPMFKNFGNSIQHEIIFKDLDLLLIINSGFMGFPSYDGKIKALTDDWFLPYNKECFYGDNLNEDSLKAIGELLNGMQIYVPKPDNIIIIPVYRVRKYIDNRAKELGLDLNLDRAKEIEKLISKDDILIG